MKATGMFRSEDSSSRHGEQWVTVSGGPGGPAQGQGHGRGLHLVMCSHGVFRGSNTVSGSRPGSGPSVLGHFSVCCFC